MSSALDDVGRAYDSLLLRLWELAEVVDQQSATTAVLRIAGAVETEGRGSGRTWLAVIGDYAAVALGAFVAGNVASGSTVVSDGWPGYKRLKDVKHDPKVVGDAPAHLIL